MKLVVAFLVITLAQAARVRLEGAAELEGCGPETCTTFDTESKECQCNDFEHDPKLAKRMLMSLTDTMQRLRKVSDKLTKESGTFDKMWWGNSIGKAQKDLHLLEEAVENLPGLQQFMSATPAQAAEAIGWKPPAAAYPITVEIWDDNPLTQQQFIGETGVPLAEGSKQYNNVPLELNKHQTNAWVYPEEGKVSFETHLEKSEPFDCDFQGMKRCVRMSLTAKCNGASTLPNTDTLSKTDAYCKIRVKKNPSTPAVTFKTKVVYNNLNPEFDEVDTSDGAAHISNEPLVWEVPLIEPIPTNEKPDEGSLPESEWVPWVLDEMIIGEQMESQVLYLASNVFLDSESKCKGASVAKACEMLESLSSVAVDTSSFEALRNNPASATADSLVQLHDQSKIHHVRYAAVHAGRRHRARRYGHRYHYGYSRHGYRRGGAGCGGCFLVLLLFFLILL